MNLDISKYEDIFLSYAKLFCDAEQEAKSMLELKIVHSQSVLNHMRTLVQEDVLAPYARACLLAALFHDVARFQQYAQWRTFKDSNTCNHAFLGVKILKEKAWLNAEPAKVQKQVLAAVSMHNRFSVPKGISQDIMLITRALRDADKLDILRVMDEHLSCADTRSSAVTLYAKDEPQAWSKNIITALLEGRIASYDDVVYVNDFRLLLGTWLHELYFESSKKILIEAGYLNNILQDLPKVAPVQEAKSFILDLLNKIKQEIPNE